MTKIQNDLLLCGDQHRHFNQRSIFALTNVNFTFAVIRTYLQGCETVVTKQQQNTDITLAHNSLKTTILYFYDIWLCRLFCFIH